MYIPSGAVLIK